jgi:MFS family permease
MFVVFSIVADVANSISVLIALRVLSGMAGCAVTATGAAVVADIWATKEKGRALSAFYVGILMGPTAGPVLGGLLVQRWGWRGLQWLLVIHSALALVIMIFAFPETIRSLLSTVASRDGQDMVNDSQGIITPKLTYYQRLVPKVRKLLHIIGRPLYLVTLLPFPIVFLTIYVASTTFLVMRMFQISLQQDFSSAPYSFDAAKVGASFLPMSLGLMIGDLAGGKWSDTVMHNSAIKAGRVGNQDQGDQVTTVYYPEERVKANAWVGITLLPVALVSYGWSIDKGVLWVAPVSQNSIAFGTTVLY